VALEAGVCPRRVGDVEQGAGGLLGRGILLGGLQRQQDRQIGVAVGQGQLGAGGQQQARIQPRDTRLLLGDPGLRLGDGYLGLGQVLVELGGGQRVLALGALAEGEQRQPHRAHQEHHQRRHQQPQPVGRAPLGGNRPALQRDRALLQLDLAPQPLLLSLAARFLLGHAGDEIIPFFLGELEIGGRDPLFVLGEARPGHQEAGVLAGIEPLRRRDHQPPVEPQVFAAGVEPVAKALPLANQRLVRHLDGRTVRHRVAVEGQQAILAEDAHHGVHRRAGHRQRFQLGQPDAPPGVFGPLAGRHQPQEQLARRFLARLVHFRVKLLGAARQRARHAAHRPVRAQRQRAPFAALEQLGERVLQQRQRARLLAHIGDNRGDEIGAQGQPGPFRRIDDGLFQLIR